ncbi:hypothetical protein BDF22DRAFT_693416 [Syncephalis plumigaleata]|nr:hypothetical protein BDF22DRAFT_693416 [Syncephalis plumigaleata]
MPAQVSILPFIGQLFTLQLPPYFYPLFLAFCVLCANSFGFSFSFTRQPSSSTSPTTTRTKPTLRTTPGGSLRRRAPSRAETRHSLPQVVAPVAMVSWEQVKQEVRRFKASLPYTATIRDLQLDPLLHRAYFLGVDPYGDIRTSSLYYTNITTKHVSNTLEDEDISRLNHLALESTGKDSSIIDTEMLLGNEASFKTTTMTDASSSSASLPVLDTESEAESRAQGVSSPLLERGWRHVLSVDWLREHWRTEQLSKERRRMSAIGGITHFQVDWPTRQLIFTYEGSHVKSIQITRDHMDYHPRLDPKLGGQRRDLISFIRNHDLWISTLDGIERQLTFSGGDNGKSNGLAEFIIQEEFNRFTGYYWSPTLDDNLSSNEHVLDEHREERIIYLEVDESEVEVVNIPCTGAHRTNEIHRYPRAGNNNNKFYSSSTLYDQSYKSSIERLWGKNNLRHLFPWYEYIVRFGWLNDGNSVWIQLLDRKQQQTVIARIPIACFSVEDKETTESVEVLYEESSPYWINVTNIIHFLQIPSAHNQYTTVFLMASEKSGIRQIYRVVTRNGVWRATPITPLQLHVMDAPISIDEQREQVYFMAKSDNALETHLWRTFITSHAESGDHRRLTKQGRSVLNFLIDHASSIMALQLSNSRKGTIWEMVQMMRNREETRPLERISRILHLERPPSIPTPEYFQFTIEEAITLYGCYYKPEGYDPNVRYPTLLHIYGGPCSQLVTDEFKYPRHTRLYLAARLGFAVVIIDGRGSSERGLAFEAPIQHRLGRVELADQLTGLRWLARERGIVDLERVAISGWSYGGYLALMGLALYPDAFKLAIAGAPVTKWEEYDSAYTERYMGLPSEHPTEYRLSSIMHYIDYFPNEENRLLLIHGLMDENVHFTHTEQLVNALIKRNKPYQIQIYPGERHGLRNPESNEHYETLLFWWLLNHL